MESNERIKFKMIVSEEGSNTNCIKDKSPGEKQEE